MPQIKRLVFRTDLEEKRPYVCSFRLMFAFYHRALMVKEDHRSAFHTIDDLKQCRILSKNICYIDGDSTETFWKSIVSERYVNLQLYLWRQRIGAYLLQANKWL